MQYIATILLSILIPLVIKLMSMINELEIKITKIDSRQLIIKHEIEAEFFQPIAEINKRQSVFETNLTEIHHRIKKLEKRNAN